MLMLIFGGFFILGLVIGSFVNAVVWRIQQQLKVKSEKLKVVGASKVKGQRSKVEDELSIIKGRSMCPECRHALGPMDLVPVLSWMMLDGKCRYCHKPISMQYPLVEILTGLLFALSAFPVLRTSYSVLQIVDLVFWLYFLTVLIILALYDLRWYILPDVVLLPAIGVALVRLPVLLMLGKPLAGVVGFLLAGLAVGAFFYALAAVSKGRWMGGGDIKLVFLMGLVLGWSKLAVALLLAFNSGAIVGVLLIALKIKHRRDHIPFGPFLVSGTIIAMLYGQVIIDWYWRLMGI